MTTLRDLLNDFAHDIRNIQENADVSFAEQKDELLDELMESIKERIIG